MFRPKLLSAPLLFCLAVAANAAPATYTIDPAHTYPSFEAPHIGVSIWRGKFNKSSGKVTLDREARSGAVDIVIDMDSVDFGHDKMNEHAKKDDFFDVAKYPTATYKGKILFKADMPAAVEGELTLHGVTRPLKLDIVHFTCTQHRMLKKEVCGADAKGEFHRGDFGVTKAADGDLGKTKLAIQVEALKD